MTSSTKQAIAELLLVILVGGVIYIAGLFMGDSLSNDRWQLKIQQEYISQVEANRITQEKVNEISKQYQDALEGLEGSTDSIINDLNANNKRLRVRLSNTARQLKDNGRCIPNEKAELDPEFSKRLIRITQEGDLWIQSLQDTIREMQATNK